MKVPPHIISLYYKTARRYKKLISKIQRETASSYQRKAFIHQLKKLAKKLQDLQLQLKIAAATGAVVLLLNATPVQAQSQLEPNFSTLGPFIKQDRAHNPLREPLFTGEEPALTVVDFDRDGDHDIVVGEYDDGTGGYLRYFENKTSEGLNLYEELLDSENPFNGIYATTGGVAPAFADIDNDGDLDLFLGQNGWYASGQTSRSGIEYYRNASGVFTKQDGAWNEATKVGNPFDGVALGDYVRPVFIDFDKDGDLDVIIGSRADDQDGTEHHIHYYKNNGSGTFTLSPTTLVSSTYLASWAPLSPALADIDNDGDFDLVLASYYYEHLLYYKQDTPGNFVEVTGAWDPTAKTGNPFGELELGSRPSPVFIDFNGDDNPDLFVADDDGAKYSDQIIDYYENSGNSVYNKVDGLKNPFDGVFVKGSASPVLLDLDGDNNLEAVIGNKYNGSYWDYDLGQTVYVYSSLTQYKKNEDTYEKVTDESNPFEDLELEGYFAPQFADIDGDADLDIISGGNYGDIAFFRNDDGVYVREYEMNPFAGIWVGYNEASAKLVDIDSDGDLDLFASNGYGQSYFYRNDGTLTNPEFIQQYGVDNPLTPILNLAASGVLLFPNFTDIDHDGDLDVFFEGPNYSDGQNEVLYFENTGTKESPDFQTRFDNVLPGVTNNYPQLDFIDHDEDGDLDALIGVRNGTIVYLENQNPVVTTTVTGTVGSYEFGNAPVTIEPNLTLADPDEDLIIQATVTIENFQSGEILNFTPRKGISGLFDASTGVLTFRGKSTVAEYQSLLRTVTFEINATEGGRTRPVKKATTARTISFAVYDIDFTNPQVAPKTLNVFVNTPPVIEPEPLISGKVVKIIKLLDITTDVDENLDPTSFTIVQQPKSSAVARIVMDDTESPTEVNLHIDYSGIVFNGTDELTIGACDDLAACTERVLSVEIDAKAEVVVFNAIAPNSSGDNQYMRIHGLIKGNKVSIYNRWGDLVYNTTDYEDAENENVFKGLSNNGNALSSGTYYYTIEMPGKNLITGYLTLKQ